MELLLRKEAPADNFLLLRRRQRFGRGENISFRPPPAFFFAERLFLLSSRSADVTRHLQKEREEEKEEEEEGDSPKNEMCHLGTHCSPRLHKLNYFYAGMHVCTSDCKLAPAAPYRLGKMHTTFFFSARPRRRERSHRPSSLADLYFPTKKGERGASAAKRKAGTKESSSISAIPSWVPPRSAEQSKQIPSGRRGEGGNPFFFVPCRFRTGGAAPGFIHPFLSLQICVFTPIF